MWIVSALTPGLAWSYHVNHNRLAASLVPPTPTSADIGLSGPLVAKVAVALRTPLSAAVKLSWTVHVPPAATATPVHPSVPLVNSDALVPPIFTALTVIDAVELLVRVTVCGFDPNTAYGVALTAKYCPSSDHSSDAPPP